MRARAWTVGWDRSSGINGKLPALRFPISLQLRGDELAERRHASRRRLTAKRRVLLERALSVYHAISSRKSLSRELINSIREGRARRRGSAHGWMGWKNIDRGDEHAYRSIEREFRLFLEGRNVWEICIVARFSSRAIFEQLNIYVTSAQHGDAFVWMRRVPFTFRWSLCLKNVRFGKISIRRNV